MLEQDIQALNDQFFSAFNEQDPQIIVDNQPVNNVDKTQVWCRWSHQPQTEQAATCGTQAQYQQNGQSTLQVFVPQGLGMAAAFEVQAKFTGAFRGWSVRDQAGYLIRSLYTTSTPVVAQGYSQINCVVRWTSLGTPDQ